MAAVLPWFYLPAAAKTALMAFLCQNFKAESDVIFSVVFYCREFPAFPFLLAKRMFTVANEKVRTRSWENGAGKKYLLKIPAGENASLPENICPKSVTAAYSAPHHDKDLPRFSKTKLFAQSSRCLK